MLYIDKPIRTEKEDVLKRAPLARRVAELILRYHGGESYVIGIEGKWGAGKTSFINLIQNRIDNNGKVLVISFNPWNFSSQNELLTDFFNSLTHSFDDMSKDRTLRTALTKYLQKIGRLGISPTVSFRGLSISFGKPFTLGKEPTLLESRDKINESIKKLNKKVVIIIDDIDRLDKKETLFILKLVKMTASFSNTVFLLAFDREKVIKRIGEDGIPGDEYVKKIVQVSFSLPIPDPESLKKVIFKHLDSVLDSIYGGYVFNKDEQQRWSAIFFGGFFSLFKTIRDISNYMSSLELSLTVVNREDINLVDFIGIEAIRVFAPEFYSAIAGNKSLLTNTHELFVGMNTRTEDEVRQKRYEELLSVVSTDNGLRHSIQGICKELFPQLNFRTTYGSEWKSGWRLDRRVCSVERFDFYFQLGIPEGAISETEINAILQTLNNPSDFKSNLLLLEKQGLLGKMISSISDRLESISESDVKVIIVSLWSLDGVVSDERKGLFSLDDFSNQVARLTYQSLKRVVLPENRDNFILSILDETQNIHFSSRLLAVFNEQIEKKNANELLVDSTFVPILRQKILEVIKVKSVNGTLGSENRLDVALFEWFKWEGADGVKSYIAKLIRSDKGIIQLLNGFKGMVYSSNEGAYMTMGKDALGKLYPIQKIEAKVRSLNKRRGQHLPKQVQELIKVFENPPKQW